MGKNLTQTGLGLGRYDNSPTVWIIIIMAGYVPLHHSYIPIINQGKMAKSKVDIEPKDFANQQLAFDDTGGTETKMMMSSTLGVEDIVGEITKGMRRCGLTAGQFSMSDLIEHVLRKIGPADLYLSTWAASSDGLNKTFEFLDNGMLRNVKFMIDTGAKQYRDNQFGKLLEKFGDCIRTTRIHAKFFVLRNEEWNIVVRTSANLNKNLRLELFEIDENKDFADFFQKFFDEAFKQIAVNENHRVASSQKLKDILDSNGAVYPNKENDFKIDVNF